MEYAEPENRNRRQVLNYIRDNPGVTFKRISQVLELNEGTLRYHLRTLHREKWIRSCIKDGIRCYFVSLFVGADDTETKGTAGKHHRRILSLIKGDPGITISGILDRTNASKRKVTYSINNLLKKRIIRKVESDGDTGYEYVTREMIIREMLVSLVKDLADGKIDEETFMRLRSDIESYR